MKTTLGFTGSRDISIGVVAQDLSGVMSKA